LEEESGKTVVFSGFLGRGQAIWINQKIALPYLGEEKTVYFAAKRNVSVKF
jgi:hypothetical protein